MDNEYISPHDESKAILREMKGRGFPGMIEVLKIMRGGGSVEEDKDIKELYRRQGLSSSGTGERRKRGDIFNSRGREQPSVLGSIKNKNNEFSNNIK